MTSGDVMNEARKVYLNDAGASLYTDAILIPFVSAAYDWLMQKLELANTTHLEEISTAITVTAGSTILTLPSDFVKAVRLKERSVGATDADWIDMTKKDWEPTEVKSPELQFWTDREDGIKFLGATTDRQVLLYYYKTLTPITTNAIVIPVVNALRSLALKTASLAAMSIGQNMTLADKYSSMAEEAKDDLIINNIKNQQNLPVRRRRISRTRGSQFIATRT